MAAPIRFTFDFASPYAYFALDGVERVAAAHGRSVEWRPVLLWAVLKAHGVAPPLDAAAKHDYFVTDMPRSAAFYGVDYRQPGTLGRSTHRAARLYHALTASAPDCARAFGRAAFSAFFAEGLDISREDELVRVAARVGVAADTALEAMNGDVGRRLLAEAIEAAVGDKVIGSPFFIVDGEPFFGVDRLPQIEWRLSQNQPK